MIYNDEWYIEYVHSLEMKPLNKIMFNQLRSRNIAAKINIDSEEEEPFHTRGMFV